MINEKQDIKQVEQRNRLDIRLQKQDKCSDVNCSRRLGTSAWRFLNSHAKFRL